MSLPSLPHSDSVGSEDATMASTAAAALNALIETFSSPIDAAGGATLTSFAATAAVAGALVAVSARQARRLRRPPPQVPAGDEGDLLLAANALPVVKERGFSVVSSNLLTRGFHRRSYGSYCAREHAAWEHRLAQHKRLMQHINADIYAIQEGSIGHFEEDFASLRDEGYELVVPWDKIVKKDPARANTLDKTGLIFRRDVFDLEWVDHRSRVLIVQLRHRALSKPVFIANCHLEGHPQKADSRFSQLKSALEIIVKRGGRDAAVVFCGDFNSSRSCTAYELLAEGRLSAGSVDPWMPDKPVCTADYESSLPLRDCYAGSRLASHPTYLGAGSPQQIDFVFASPGLQVEALREPHTAEQWEDARKAGVPNAWHPSDHFAIGAALVFA